MSTVEDSVVRRSRGIDIFSLSPCSFHLQSSGRREGNIVIPAALPASQDRKGAERSFASLCLCGTSRNKPATQVRGQCAKWVARSKNTKKPSSSVVWARAGGWGGGYGLWFTLKLRRRNEKLLFTFQTDCSLYFHPRPNKSKGEELWKMRLWSGRGNVNQSSDPTLIYKSKLQVRQSRVLQHGVYTV